MGQIVLSGDNAAIIGTTLGLEAIVMGKVIGESGSLYVMTPMDYSYNLVKKNIELNKL